MIHVPERIGIIGDSGMYDINKGVKPQYCSDSAFYGVFFLFSKLILLNLFLLTEQYWVKP